VTFDAPALRMPARRKRSVLAARSRPPRTAFVLAGGASLGALHARMVQALYEREVTADLLVGTSAGVLSAA
jgi:predicted acylesterase/phospholipase RssA